MRCTRLDLFEVHDGDIEDDRSSLVVCHSTVLSTVVLLVELWPNFQ